MKYVHKRNQHYLISPIAYSGDYHSRLCWIFQHESKPAGVSRSWKFDQSTSGSNSWRSRVASLCSTGFLGRSELLANVEWRPCCLFSNTLLVFRFLYNRLAIVIHCDSHLSIITLPWQLLSVINVVSVYQILLSRM